MIPAAVLFDCDEVGFADLSTHAQSLRYHYVHFCFTPPGPRCSLSVLASWHLLMVPVLGGRLQVLGR
eukprot:COSAG02_NODE_62984_length_264_cov_0.921212_1_plen_66_part_10